MKSFGLGLALLASGLACYLLQPAATTALSEQDSVIPLAQKVISAYPFIFLGVMAFGVIWFWVIQPLCHFTRPREEEK